MFHLYYLMALGFILMVTPDSQLYTPVVDIQNSAVAGVGLGRKKKNCRGKGVCIISSEIKTPGSGDRIILATLTFSGESLTSMFIDYSDLNENVKKEYFSGDHFIMEESYSGPFKRQKKAVMIHIPKGKYPISQQKNGLKIGFD